MTDKILNTLTNLIPGSKKVKNKFIFYVLIASVILVSVSFILGITVVKKACILAGVEHLDELSFIKKQQLENKFTAITDQLLAISEDSRMQTVSEQLVSAFKSFKDERYDLFESVKLGEISREMTRFYSDVVAGKQVLSRDKTGDLLPDDEITLAYQYLYVYKNPAPFGEKFKTNSFDDVSSYSLAHAGCISYLADIVEQLKAKDLFIVDALTGMVVFSYTKNIDFATNLYKGTLKNTALAGAFREAVISNKSKISVDDFTNYCGAFDKPVAFLSVPIRINGTLNSILIIQISSEIFEEVLYDKYLLTGKGSMEFILIGEDLFLRNNPRGFLSDPEQYIKQEGKDANRKEMVRINTYSDLGSLVMLAQFHEDVRSIIKSDKAGKIFDYNNKKCLAGSTRISFSNLHFYLISKIDYADILKDFRKKTSWFLFGIILVVLVIIIITDNLGSRFSNRIIKIRESVNAIYKGEKSKTITDNHTDEISETVNFLNNLNDRIQKLSSVLVEMSESNFKQEMEVISNKDVLGLSVKKLRGEMIRNMEEHEVRAREDEINNWINTGIAKFNDLLRKNNDDITVLAYSLVENLTEYLEANQAGVFLVEGETDSDKLIQQIAAYAYDRKKFDQKTIRIGEGLLGNCYLEKRSINLRDLPQDYINITSGLGESTPRNLYIVPLKVDENVLGMIEIASFNLFEEHHIQFIEKVADSIAATFISVRLNMQTAKLLKESTRRSEENAQQEEEMRQNLEEMQATQEEMARMRQEDERRSKEMQKLIENSRTMLKKMLDAIPGGYILKDQNAVIQMVNKEGAEYYDKPVEFLPGKTDHEMLDAESLEQEHKQDQKALDQGTLEYDEVKKIKENKIKYHVIKKAFFIDEVHQTGILTIRYKK